MKRISALILAGALAACSQQAEEQNGDEGNPAAPNPTQQVSQNAELDQKVMASLEQCKQIKTTCSDPGVGYLVFPDVTSVALGVGGEGGEGALVQDGRIVDYYDMGEASIGLQAGVSAASYVFKLRDQAALQQMQNDGEWSVGAEAAIVVADADANAAAEATGTDTILYVFNAEGLMADVSVDAMRIWKDENSAADPNMNPATATPTT